MAVPVWATIRATMKRRSAPLLLGILLVVAAVVFGCSGRVSPGPTSAQTSGSSAPPASQSTVASPTAQSTGSPTAQSTPGTSTPPSGAVTTGSTAPPVLLAIFAVIGDYGMDDEHEAAVASMVASWHPAYIITTGDDYYSPAGGKGTARYDESTGAYYGAWLKDVTTTGKRCPVGLAPINAFFPCLGNHDYNSATPAPATYLTYFDLPGAGFDSSSGNERYYDFVEGPIHFFVLNSNQVEPDGTSSTSTQAQWLKTQLAASNSTWNIIYDHHPPYCSDLVHGSTRYMQWPFAEWGADAVLSGHAHAYERIERDGIVYFVNGLGGAARYIFGLPIAGSQVRYNADWGAQKVTVAEDALVFEFWSADGELIDSYRLPAR
jgi:tartrate-resistant acid phosphatase type 5